MAKLVKVNEYWINPDQIEYIEDDDLEGLNSERTEDEPLLEAACSIYFAKANWDHTKNTLFIEGMHAEEVVKILNGEPEE